MILLLGLCGCQAKVPQSTSVDAQIFTKVLGKKHMQILDVRTAQEYAEGHIANSILLDVTQEEFLTKAKKILDKKHPVALYCRSGKRSKKAAALLQQEGFHIIELGGGFNEWKAEGLPVQK